MRRLITVDQTIATIFQPDIEHFVVLQEFARQPFIVLRFIPCSPDQVYPATALAFRVQYAFNMVS